MTTETRRKLYEIAGDIAALKNAVADNGGILTEELDKKLGELELEESEKLDACFASMREVEAMIASAKGEEQARKKHYDDAKARRGSFEQELERLRDYILHQMRQSGTEGHKSDLCTISRVRRGPSIKSFDLDKISRKFVKVTVRLPEASFSNLLTALDMLVSKQVITAESRESIVSSIEKRKDEIDKDAILAAYAELTSAGDGPALIEGVVIEDSESIQVRG